MEGTTNIAEKKGCARCEIYAETSKSGRRRRSNTYLYEYLFQVKNKIFIRRERTKEKFICCRAHTKLGPCDPNSTCSLFIHTRSAMKPWRCFSNPISFRFFFLSSFLCSPDGVQFRCVLVLHLPFAAIASQIAPCVCLSVCANVCNREIYGDRCENKFFASFVIVCSAA